MQNDGQHLPLFCSSPLRLAEQFYGIVFLYNMIVMVTLCSCPVMQEMFMERKKGISEEGMQRYTRGLLTIYVKKKIKFQD